MIDIDKSLLLIIDIQEKLVRMLGETDLPKNIYALTKAAEILNIDTVITEQYPKGLGATLESVKDSNSRALYFEKTSFSALRDDIIADKIEELGKNQVIICGIEAHICVLQTAIELINKGYEVFFVNDCSASRKKSDFNSAEELLKQYGVKIVSKEIVIFSWLKTSRHPNFKEIQALIK